MVLEGPWQGGGGAWVLGLAPNPGFDQGSCVFYFILFYLVLFYLFLNWLSMLVLCGRFCLPIILFPIVHQKSLKTTGLANCIYLVNFQVLQGLNWAIHKTLSTVIVI